MPGVYEIRQAKNDQFFFNLVAPNGQVILSSELYNTKSAAKKGVAAVQKNSAVEQRFDRRLSANSLPFFVLKSGNHQVIGKSETYEAAAAMEKGIKAVLKNGNTTKIKDMTVA